MRARYLRWGSTDQELNVALPGDELVPDADLTATRAITVRAPPDGVWPWIAQLGQRRGGFYSYELIENVMGCHIHNADRIVSEWQAIAVGDEVHLHPEVSLSVAVAEPGRALVLRGGVAIGRTPAPYDFTWAFVLHGQADQTTRLVVRERYSYARPWARLLIEPTEFISFVMSRRMLRGIKQRAEHAVVATSTPQQVRPRRFTGESPHVVKTTLSELTHRADEYGAPGHQVGALETLRIVASCVGATTRLAVKPRWLADATLRRLDR